MAIDYSKILYHTRHGGAYDRGRADRYYNRPCNPHFYQGATYSSERIEGDFMPLDYRAAYMQGYNDEWDQKDWGIDEDDYPC